MNLEDKTSLSEDKADESAHKKNQKPQERQLKFSWVPDRTSHVFALAL